MSVQRDLKKLRLERFCLHAAKYFSNYYPDWVRFMSAKENIVDGLSVFTLEINIPSENPSVPDPMTITVELDRVITLWWFRIPELNWRWETDWVTYLPDVWDNMPPDVKANKDCGFESVVSFIEEFRDEKIVAYMGMNGYGYCSSAADALVELKNRDDWVICHSCRGAHDFVQGIPSEP